MHALLLIIVACAQELMAQVLLFNYIMYNISNMKAAKHAVLLLEMNMKTTKCLVLV